MGKIKGQTQYEKFLSGKQLTRKEAILANCYQCNGLEDSNEDCQGSEACPMYQVSHYSGYKIVRSGFKSHMGTFKRGDKR